MRRTELTERRRELEASLDAGRRELERALGDLADAAWSARPLREFAVRHRYGLLLAAFAAGMRLGHR